MITDGQMIALVTTICVITVFAFYSIILWYHKTLLVPLLTELHLDEHRRRQTYHEQVLMPAFQLLSSQKATPAPVKEEPPKPVEKPVRKPLEMDSEELARIQEILAGRY